MAQAIFTEGAAPATPATGKVAVYAKTDGKMYALDDAGLERSLGGDAASTTQAGIVELATEAEVATGTSTTLVPSVDSFRKANVVAGTSVAYTSFTTTTYHDFLNIPSWVKKITFLSDGLSTNGTSGWLLQIGDSGGVETTGYNHVASYSGTGTGGNSSAVGFILIPAAAGTATNTLYGKAMEICLMDSAANKWAAANSGSFTQGGSVYALAGGGTKALSAALDRIRITTINGTDTFDAGSINILYE